jgi:hypothetical protein
MELGGLEPPTSWVRCRSAAAQNWVICSAFARTSIAVSAPDNGQCGAIPGNPGTGSVPVPDLAATQRGRASLLPLAITFGIEVDAPGLLTRSMSLRDSVVASLPST